MRDPAGAGPLRVALREVAAAFNALPAAVQAELDLVPDPGEAAIDAALLAGDDAAALDAIRAWRDKWLCCFVHASQVNPTPPEPCLQGRDPRSMNPTVAS